VWLALDRFFCLSECGMRHWPTEKVIVLLKNNEIPRQDEIPSSDP
jgi:hypothetical protein